MRQRPGLSEFRYTQWAQQASIELQYIQPGQPQQNA
ncbi:hypothetical protein ABIC71_004430 [Herbaspirillum seropedicae]